MIAICRSRTLFVYGFAAICALAVSAAPLHALAQLNRSVQRARLPSNAPGGQHAFDFAFGAFTVHISRLLHPLTGATTWVKLKGTHVTSKVWNGRANLGVMEVDGPTGHIEGLTLSLYDPSARQWSISFSSSAAGVLGHPAVGSFKNGRGSFFDQESYNGRTILVRSVFSDITPASYRMEQAFSDDGGVTWEKNWLMTFARIKHPLKQKASR